MGVVVGLTTAESLKVTGAFYRSAMATRPRDDEWAHASGHRLNYDGARIKYTHPSGIEASVEAMMEPEDGEIVYRPAVFASDGTFIQYPPKVYDTDRALDRLHEFMDTYPETDE